MRGKVRHGDARGRLLGFKTANLLKKDQLLPPFGVYATFCTIQNKRYPAVTNVGIRPTFGGDAPVIESHLFDRDLPDFYGKEMEVEFVAPLRPEKKFGSKDELLSQIAIDITKARNVLT